MKSRAIRETFLNYFKGLNHSLVPSASLVPEHDPTLFFVNAGMVPFKRYFTGEAKAPYPRAASSQKCLRVSGKHNDLENVGVTSRHHTFFEMLGNFSFGDYFKREAILWGWEFLTKTCHLAKDQLWVSVYVDDDDAARIWEKDVAVPKARIVRLGEKDNFWAMGPTGPCGPCSEIHIDRGIRCPLNNPKCSVDCDCDRFIEIWNLVFMQYNRDESGKLSPLPKPSIDTGMGLERLAMILQGKLSNYDTDLFTPVIDEICALTGIPYGEAPERDVSIRVLADHIRASSFLIADGVLPHNDGRGYVLRRILRRAIRHGHLLGMDKPFFYRLHDVLAKEMGETYPELRTNAAFVKKAIQTEEARFLETLDRGTGLLDEEMERLKRASAKILPGKTAFKLYDTFGFPADLTELILKQGGFDLDWEGFEAAMHVQKGQGKQAWVGTGAEKLGEIYTRLADKLPKAVFTGYDRYADHGTIVAIIKNGQSVQSLASAECAELVLDRTPFYPEGGGQVGDKGSIEKDGSVFSVSDTQKPAAAFIVHRGTAQGTFKVGDRVEAHVAESERRDTMKNHTATHLLHAALRRQLGEHVKQAGSVVEAKRLRFDFSHFEPVPLTVLREIEKEVNDKILADIDLCKAEMSHKDAIKKGALAFFGEKYGERVRVIEIGEYSTELCGGTHVDRTGEIGLFKIVSEASVASGVRRIEAVTGREALAYVNQLEDICRSLGQSLKTGITELPDRVEKLQLRLRQIEKESKRLAPQSASWKQAITEKNGVRYLVHEVESDAPEILRQLSDEIRADLQSGVLLLIGKGESKVILLVAVGKALTDRFHAGKLVQALAPLVGGKGGGRPDLAQAGGSNLAGVAQVIEAFEQKITEGNSPLLG